MVSILYIAVAVGLTWYNPYDSTYGSCAVGFSGVLFSLKVVLNYGSAGHSTFFGLTLPTKYLCWFELILISLISPHSSFLGHLCGIGVGFMFVAGIFEPIFKITDQLGIDEAFSRLQEQYNYDENAPAPQQPRGRMGGMGRMGMMGMGMGGFRRGYF
eukprot:CAMPEP_0201596184 /NCGR_PEP_ID=MMETSP0190_2-20130828/192950_1 /ASSEMBLY_ACC=CAM_ASM_000263 /TAXON_ID=37353 /ORGANISM="Rosalina sp." /LENGTH=156 /DNA_ID=CAMNT_0048056439 /DNA_START=451 /DNA_END=924 /DNA_ORIENTATION=-